MQGGGVGPRRSAFGRGFTPRLVGYLGALTAASVVLGCDTVAMNFGDVSSGAIANVYFQQLPPAQGTAVTHGAFCTVIQAEAAAGELGTIRSHEQPLVTTRDGALVLHIDAEEGAVAERSFEPAFFESHQVTTFTATLVSGNTYRYSVWGADNCEACPPGAPADGDTCFLPSQVPVSTETPTSHDPPAVVE